MRKSTRLCNSIFLNEGHTRKILLGLILACLFAVTAVATVEFSPGGPNAGNWSYDGAGTVSFVRDFPVDRGLASGTDALVGALVHLPDFSVGGVPNGPYTLTPNGAGLVTIMSPDNTKTYMTGTLGLGDLIPVGTTGVTYTAYQVDITNVTVTDDGRAIGSDALDAIDVEGCPLDFELSLQGAPAVGFKAVLDNGLTAYDGFSAAMSIICPPVECTASIGDFVWMDDNGDGIQGPGESGIEGVRVLLADDQGPLMDTLTDPNGLYMFNGLCPGTYTVSVDSSTVSADLIPTYINVSGSTPENDSDDPDGTEVTLAEGEENITIDFGYYLPCLASIGDFVWLDDNGDGIQDAGEMGIEGVRIVLDDGQGTWDTTTDADGFYFFGDLCPGDYTVTVDSSTVSADLVVTSINDPGATPETDSDDPTGTPATLAGHYDEDLTIDFGYIEVIEECSECKGKVSELTLQYNGSVSALVVVKQKDNVEVFNAVLTPGQQFTLIGQDDKGTLGTEISLYVGVDCTTPTKIHTSCSQPIGPGVVAGPFEVVSAYSLEGGLICTETPQPPSDDCECDGKVTDLTLQYLGDEIDAEILVTGKISKKMNHDKHGKHGKHGIHGKHGKFDKQKKDPKHKKHDSKGKHGKKGKKEDSGDPIFIGVISSGDIFTIYGNDSKGTLGTEINLLVNGLINANIHTSCSKPIGPGLIVGDFLVVDGNSRNGGPLCPLDSTTPPDDGSGECDGKATQLTLQFTGDFAAQVTVRQRNVTDAIFDDTLQPNDLFVINGADKDNTLGVEIDLFIDGQLNTKIHTSCSRPIGPGLVSGDFLVTEGYSRNGGKLIPLP